MHRFLDAVYRVLACFIPGQPGWWRDETCTHVSTGQRWTALDPLLAAWGFVGEPAPRAPGGKTHHSNMETNQ